MKAWETKQESWTRGNENWLGESADQQDLRETCLKEGVHMYVDIELNDGERLVNMDYTSISREDNVILINRTYKGDNKNALDSEDVMLIPLSSIKRMTVWRDARYEHITLCGLMEGFDV